MIDRLRMVEVASLGLGRRGPHFTGFDPGPQFSVWHCFAPSHTMQMDDDSLGDLSEVMGEDYGHGASALVEVAWEGWVWNIWQIGAAPYFFEFCESPTPPTHSPHHAHHDPDATRNSHSASRW
jgi:hypothetical protein